MTILRTRHGYVARGVLTLFAGFSMACSGIFDVEDPQAFGNDDLNNPVIVKNVADGAEGSLQQAYDDFVTVAALLGDEMESTSTWIDWENISDGRLRGDEATGGSFSGPQDQLLRARFAAQDAARRVTEVLGAGAATSPLMAQVLWTDAFADLTVGMGWCEGPLVANGPRAPNTEFFKQAVTKLTAALTAANSIAAAADKANWVNTITASRARANLFAGNYDAALADALAVPAGFVKNAIYAEAAGNQQSTTGNQFHQNRNRSGGLRRMYHSRVLGTFTTTAYATGALADWYDNTKPDPRMSVNRKSGELGVNNRFAYYGITKYADRAADQPMISSREMNLIAAEVYMRKNDYANMTAKLNIDRRANGLADIVAPTTAAAAQNALLNERMAVLFTEGQRALDLHRFNLVTSVLGAGRNTLLPLSRNEILANTSMKVGEATCPKIS
ncbi:MAG: RagB/SusD family nutrient uptake outer membrane protein [Gemmatimonadaceae bacterium]|nr:RagB/SusD family nutrient uptake outer membrane protein [Gemmatimonadaceae bacterium]